MSKRIDLDKNKLIELKNEGKTRQEIADEFSVKTYIVDHNLKRYGLTVPSSKRKIIIDEDELRNGVLANKSNKELSLYFGVSESVIKTNLRDYGIRRTREQISFLSKQGCLKKYGVDNISKIPEVRQEAIKTWQEKTGLENPYLDPEMRQKKEKTCLERYGVRNPSQNEEIKEKIKQTNRVKYGAESPASSRSVVEKMSSTYKKRTGYSNPSNNPEVIEKRKLTNIKLYGVPNYDQKHFSEKAKGALFSKESFEKYLQTCGLNTTEDIAIDLSVSASTIVKTAAKYNLKGYAIVNTSKGEQDLRSFIESLGIFTIHAKGTVIPHLDIDIYCPDYNIGFEFNGIYWHSTLRQTDPLYHHNKSKLCEEQGIRLIHVYEDEWKDPIKQEIIKSLIKIALGKVENKIYTRECEVREITNKEACPFNEANHIQGHRNAKVTYGLFFKDQLVQLMSFSWNSHYKAWEIIRGCPGSNNIVIGGVSKLFKHFIKEYNPDKIFSYCDYNKFNGAGYEAIGMTYIGETKYNKWYIINNKRSSAIQRNIRSTMK